MAKPTRADLEQAARQFFEQLRAGLDQPRRFDVDYLELEVAQAQEHASEEIATFDTELVQNEFGYASTLSADKMMREAGIDPAALDQTDLIVARQLAARALRAQWQLYIHQLTDPAGKLERPLQIGRAARERHQGRASRRIGGLGPRGP